MPVMIDPATKRPKVLLKRYPARRRVSMTKSHIDSSTPSTTCRPRRPSPTTMRIAPVAIRRLQPAGSPCLGLPLEPKVVCAGSCGQYFPVLITRSRDQSHADVLWARDGRVTPVAACSMNDRLRSESKPSRPRVARGPVALSVVAVVMGVSFLVREGLPSRVTGLRVLHHGRGSVATEPSDPSGPVIRTSRRLVSMIGLRLPIQDVTASTR